MPAKTQRRQTDIPRAIPVAERQIPRAEPVQAAGNAAMLQQMGAHGNKANDDDSYGADLDDMRWGERRRTKRDRVQAAHDLHERFQLLPPGFQGERKPNQLTRGEWERVVVLYSDIRMGHTAIQFEAREGGLDEDELREAVLDDIETILTTEQGRALLDEVAYADMGGPREDEQTVILESDTALGAVGGGQGGPDRANSTNGIGHDSLVMYKPGESIQHEGGTDPWLDGMTSDQILFHELIHANNARNGEFQAQFDEHGRAIQPAIPDAHAHGTGDIGAPREEYATVGIGEYGGRYTENQYRAERAEVTGQAIPERTNYNLSQPGH